MPEYFKAPQLASRFQREQDDYDSVQSVPREAMDDQYNRVLRGADAGPLSQGSRRAQAQEKNAVWGLRDQANKMGAKANAFKQNLSDRDLQWQNMQQDRDRNFQLQEREMANRESTTKYNQDRDAVNDKRSDSAQELAVITAMMSSGNEMTKLQGEELYEKFRERSTSQPASAAQPPAQAEAPAAPYPVASDGYYEMTNAPTQPPATAAGVTPRGVPGQKMEALIARMKAEDERKKLDHDLQIEEKRRGFAKDDAATVKTQATEDRTRNNAILQAQLNALDPDDLEGRAEINRQIVQANSVAGAAPYPPTAFAPSKRALATRDLDRRKEAESLVTQELEDGPLAATIQDLRASVSQVIKGSKSFWGDRPADEAAVASVVAKAKQLVSEMESRQHDPKATRSVIMNRILPPLSELEMSPAEKQFRDAIAAALNSAGPSASNAPRGRYTQAGGEGQVQPAQPPADLAQAATDFAKKPFKSSLSRFGQL